MENKFEEDYIERYVKKIGLIREKNPKSFKQIFLDKIRIFVNFGDLPSSLSFGNIVLPKLTEGNHYNVVLTWKGTSAFYPEADEVWYLDRGYILGDFYSKSKGLSNDSTNIQILMRSLNEHFVNVSHIAAYNKYFTNGITNLFLNEFRNMLVKPLDFLTLVYLNNDYKTKYLENNKKSCVLLPFKHAHNIENGNFSLSFIDQYFYVEILKKLTQNGWFVYCLQNGFTYDLSSISESEKVAFIKEDNFYKIMSMINLTGFYFDFFADMGLLGLLSRAHVFRVITRSHYFNSRKYFEDMMFRDNSCIRNHFSFLYFGRKESDLNDMYFDNIINQFDQFFDFVQEQKIAVKTVLESKEVNLAEISKLYVKKLSPKFISLYKENKT
jgi:hypothetical protein